MKYLLTTLTLFLGTFLSAQQIYVSPTATLYVGDESDLQLGGDLENDGSVANRGTLTLLGSWPVNNLYNGLEGDIILRGSLNQTISAASVQTSGLTVNSNGMVSFTGDDFTVFNSIDFQNGVLATADPTSFVLMPNTQVSGGSTSSYFQGKLTFQGGGDMKFPVGYQGAYGPLTLNNVFGNNVEYRVFYQNPNPDTPLPGEEDLIGVSSLGLWEVELTSGTVTQSTPYTIEFSEENLGDFEITNPIRHIFKSPVIAYTPSPTTPYTSLGVESLTNTDSVTFGLITSEFGVIPNLNEPFYLALALAPRVNPDGLFYIPQIFSPSASDPDNQTFKIFGEKIVEENFRLEVYNKFGIIVYETDSFLEANEVGWDGTNKNSKGEEPIGSYFYYLRLQKENGQIFNERGTLFLLR